MADHYLGGLRPCAKCGASKPWTFDYFRCHSKQGICTLYHTCRACQGYGEGPDRRKRRGPLNDEDRAVAKKQYNRTWFERDPERARAAWRDSERRNKSKRTEARKRRWRDRDPEESKLKLAEWKERNRERVRAYTLEYQKVWRAKNPDKSREKTRRWRKANPESALISGRRWRAKKSQAEGSHSLSDIRRIYADQGGLCFYCEVELSDYHVDHFIPLARGGSDYPNNLRIACPSCNCRKADKYPWEWMPDRFAPPDF